MKCPICKERKSRRLAEKQYHCSGCGTTYMLSDWLKLINSESYIARQSNKSVA